MMTIAVELFILFCFPIFALSHKPNIVLIITDDQDSLMNGMGPMFKSKKLLSEQGTTFTNAFATTPVCCPSRASIFTGLYQHNHEVLNNTYSGGCYGHEWRKSHERSTFAVDLQKQGYTTFFAGKYLNMYGIKKVGSVGEVPPGWTRWVGLHGNSKYYNYTLSIDGRRTYFGNHYLTNVLKHYSLTFLQSVDKTKPFLMVVAPPAPHSPFTPEPKYKGYFEGKRVPRSEQFNYSNNTKKHWLVRMKPSPLPPDVINTLDAYYASRWETLLSVDDLVESIVHKLENMNIIQDTYIIFTSDNGYHLGQFSLIWDKRQMYEFDTKVPLVIRGPKVPTNYSVPSPIILPDIAPTLLYIGGVSKNSADGKSFLPIHIKIKRTFLVEYKGEKGLQDATSECWPNQTNLYRCSKQGACKCEDSANNTYSCLRGISNEHDYIYCTFDDDEGFKESYDLRKDPFQLNNIADIIRTRCEYRLKYELKRLNKCKGFSCHYNKFLQSDLKFHKCYL